MILPRQRLLPKEMDIFVCSPGGVSTTSFMEFLQKYKSINDPWDRDNLKHVDRPPCTKNPNLKAIYIYGDPFNLVISLFRRNFQEVHSRKLLSNYPSIAPISEATTFEEYLSEGIDRLKLQAHFENWQLASSDYPVMMIKYEKIWDKLPEIFDYLNIPFSEIDKFPERRARSSDWRKLSTQNQENLRSMYEDLFQKIKDFDDIVIVPGIPVKSSNRVIRKIYFITLQMSKLIEFISQSTSRFLRENYGEKHKTIKQLFRAFQK